MPHPHIIALLLAAGVAGCNATTPLGSAEVTGAQVQPAGPLDVEVDAPPPDADIYAAPQVMYDGRPTYFYNDHWYFRDNGGRWRNYRQEPAALGEHRRSFQANRPHAVVQPRGRQPMNRAPQRAPVNRGHTSDRNRR